MPQRSLFMLIGAIVLGLLAVFVMRFYLAPGSAPAANAVAAAPRTTNVVVAAVPLAFGSKIDPAKLKLAAWPTDAVPPNSFKSIAEIGATRLIVVAMDQGEPLTVRKLSGPEGRSAISYKIAENMRAATVRVTDVSGVGGFIMPGERVDVAVTLAAAGQALPTTTLLAQNIRVIAVNQDTNEAKDKPEIVQTVTIEVTPDLSQKLALAATVGTVSLSLRNPDDKVSAPVRRIQVADLHDGAVVGSMASAGAGARHVRPRRSRSAAAPDTHIEIVRGVERTSYQIARGK